MPRELLLDMINAANYMDIKDLLEVSAQDDPAAMTARRLTALAFSLHVSRRCARSRSRA